MRLVCVDCIRTVRGDAMYVCYDMMLAMYCKCHIVQGSAPRLERTKVLQEWYMLLLLPA